MAEPKVTKLELVVFEHKIEELGTDYAGFNQVYEPGAVLTIRVRVPLGPVKRS